jgi:hypothetical protein
MKRALATPILLLVALLAAMELGGSFYEATVVYPAWSAAPPATLALLQGTNSLQSTPFWIPIHVALEILLVAALVLNWSVQGRRNLILAGLLIHVAVRIWTFLYFVPEIMAFSSIAPNGPYSPELAARTAMWGTLGWLRRGLIALDSLVLLIALTRPVTQPGSIETDPRTRHRPRWEREPMGAG